MWRFFFVVAREQKNEPKIPPLACTKSKDNNKQAFVVHMMM
jgi:hypothetical protein